MGYDQKRTLGEILLDVAKRIRAERDRAVEEGVELDANVDRTSEHWLPEPLTPPLIKRIRSWLNPARATELRRQSAPLGGVSKASLAGSLEDLLQPPAPGLDAARFHWLPTLLQSAGDGTRSTLVLQAKDLESDIPAPVVMAVLDGVVMAVDEWNYATEKGALVMTLEGVVPDDFSVDLSRSDQGRVVLYINSVGLRDSNATNSDALRP